ncbi:hypothetical protein QUF64_01480 [Anaerolineales bacterium HSG6]|nr:hypothetical protein [Anaerolineales bacterium HSG6]
MMNTDHPPSENKSSQQVGHDWRGYLAIPHEGLHVIGYRLVGHTCQYRLGDTYVKPIGTISFRQQLVGTLFPFVVFASLFLLFTLLSGLAYRHLLYIGSYVWLVIWTGLAFIAGLYTGTTIDDLRKAYLLIYGKPWHAQTPFDVFYWPTVDWSEVRKEQQN